MHMRTVVAKFGGTSLASAGQFRKIREIVESERLADVLGIIRADASREEEGCLADVIGEDMPVELLSAATRKLGLSVEEEIVSNALVGLGGFEVGDSGDVEGLDGGDGIAT